MFGRRNAEKVYRALDDQDNRPVITKAPIRLIVPARFREIGLLQIGTQTFVFGLAALVLESNEWALLNVNAYLELGPAAVELIKIDDVEYYTFQFQAGDVLFKTKELVCHSSLLYTAIEEFIFKGKMPRYVEYEDGCHLFDSAKKHTKTTASIQHSVVEFLVGFIGRDRADRAKYIREVAKSENDFGMDKLSWVPMRSVYWSAPSTVNKLAGAYFSEGIVSALVNPSERTDKIEQILRA